MNCLLEDICVCPMTKAPLPYPEGELLTRGVSMRTVPIDTKLHIKKADKAKAIILRCSKDFGGTSTDKEVMQLAGVSVMTYYKYKRELKIV